MLQEARKLCPLQSIMRAPFGAAVDHVPGIGVS